MGSEETRAVILVGHGAPALDCPRDIVARMKSLEGQRRSAKRPPSDEELALDQRIRSWPRTETNDPYRTGLLSLAEVLRPLLAPALLLVAYNEFCAPTIDQAAEEAQQRGADDIIVVSSMLTPGGIHAEVEIPEAIERIRERYPRITIKYAWPFDLAKVGAMLAAHIRAVADVHAMP